MDASPAAPASEQHVIAYRGDLGEFHVHVGVENDHAARTVTCAWMWYVARIDDGT